MGPNVWIFLKAIAVTVPKDSPGFNVKTRFLIVMRAFVLIGPCVRTFLDQATSSVSVVMGTKGRIAM